MADSPHVAIAPIVPTVADINHKAEQRFQFYLQRCLTQLWLIALLAIAPYFLFVGIAYPIISAVSGEDAEQRNDLARNTNPAIDDAPYPAYKVAANPTQNPYPDGDAINTAIAALLGGGGLVALWRAKTETDAKAHEFSIKLLTMQKELLETNRTEVVKYFENRTEGITNELRLIRDRLVMLEQDVARLPK
jgi:hypothetical protein